MPTPNWGSGSSRGASSVTVFLKSSQAATTPTAPRRGPRVIKTRDPTPKRPDDATGAVSAKRSSTTCAWGGDDMASWSGTSVSSLPKTLKSAPVLASRARPWSSRAPRTTSTAPTSTPPSPTLPPPASAREEKSAASAARFDASLASRDRRSTTEPFVRYSQPPPTTHSSRASCVMGQFTKTDLPRSCAATAGARSPPSLLGSTMDSVS
mmetsp:Transcript_8512/g.29088  ORF Transcript_8512/g.29088 Transcript_8512/m.29088 type:complete len:209 (-) Transcript_8512:956-1582(-)